MTSAPYIFDIDLRRQRRARAFRRRSRLGGPAFFTQRCAQDIAERLCDISRRFENALIIAPSPFWDEVLKTLPDDKIPAAITRCYDGIITPQKGSGSFQAADTALPFEARSFDLVISVLSLHSINDLPGGLMNISHILKPDGLMLASLFGGHTLTQLRRSFYTVESRHSGGMTPRINPMIDFSQAASLLQRAGFALPVVDVDSMTLSYETLGKLLADLRDQGESNGLTSRAPGALPATFYADLETTLKSDYPAANTRFEMTFEILWLTGWSPHKSQQKPLKPGSAQISLAKALGTREIKA